MNKVSANSLKPADLEGWMTKQGGSIKTWKKRYFILKENTLYYFKSENGVEQTGAIVLETTSTCNPESGKNKKGKFHFSVGTKKRVYCIWSDNENKMKEWVEKINNAINKLKGINNDNEEKVINKIVSKEDEDADDSNKEPEEEEGGGGSGGNEIDNVINDDSEEINNEGLKEPKEFTIHDRIERTKEGIRFLQDEDSKVLEFWHIWSESLPQNNQNEIQSGMSIEYNISTNAKMEKLTWRAAGPQSIYIQKMVDFFWNVGAPESEIDRLNDVGALMNPLTIGSWIDMSDKGGMDGGWYFPVDIPLRMAIEASDPGEASKKVVEWSEKHNVQICYSVGRDMGAAPPRQTEIRVCIPGDNLQQQLEIALDAFEVFEFPPLAESVISILKDPNSTNPGLYLSVITSSEGFVRLGLLTPNPSSEVVKKCCVIGGGDPNQIEEFSQHLTSSTPLFVEYQYLKEGFGYGVYKEGFDVVFHYNIGEDSNP